jgi:hypothetical protein
VGFVIVFAWRRGCGFPQGEVQISGLRMGAGTRAKDQTQERMRMKGRVLWPEGFILALGALFSK